MYTWALNINSKGFTVAQVQVVFFNWCPPKNSKFHPESKFWAKLQFMVWDRGEREFPFPVIPVNTSLFPSPFLHFIISRPVPGKRKFWPGIKTGNTIIICSFEDGWSRHENKSNLEFYLAFYVIPRISRESRDYEPKISHSLPKAFSKSHSLPVKMECDFQFPIPFPGAKKPFPLTPATTHITISNIHFHFTSALREACKTNFR